MIPRKLFQCLSTYSVLKNSDLFQLWAFSTVFSTWLRRKSTVRHTLPHLPWKHSQCLKSEMSITSIIYEKWLQQYFIWHLYQELAGQAATVRAPRCGQSRGTWIWVQTLHAEFSATNPCTKRIWSKALQLSPSWFINEASDSHSREDSGDFQTPEKTEGEQLFIVLVTEQGHPSNTWFVSWSPFPPGAAASLYGDKIPKSSAQSPDSIWSYTFRKKHSVLLLQQFSFSLPSPLAQGRSHIFKQPRKGLVPLLFGWKHLKTFFGVRYVKVIIWPAKSGKIQLNKRIFNPINFIMEAIICS